MPYTITHISPSSEILVTYIDALYRIGILSHRVHYNLSDINTTAAKLTIEKYTLHII